MSKQIRLLRPETSQSEAAIILRALRNAGFDVFSVRVNPSSNLEHALEYSTTDVVICAQFLLDFSAADALRMVHDYDSHVPGIVAPAASHHNTKTKTSLSMASDSIANDHLIWLTPAVEHATAKAATKPGEAGGKPRWIPPNSSTIYPRDGRKSAVVCVYPTHSGMGAVAYLGQEPQPVWHKIFTSDDALAKYVDAFFSYIGVQFPVRRKTEQPHKEGAQNSG